MPATLTERPNSWPAPSSLSFCTAKSVVPLQRKPLFKDDPNDYLAGLITCLPPSILDNGVMDNKDQYQKSAADAANALPRSTKIAIISSIVGSVVLLLLAALLKPLCKRWRGRNEPR